MANRQDMSWPSLTVSCTERKCGRSPHRHATRRPAGKPCQRFFFGHDNDIQCLAIHPNRRFVATGQQIKEGGVPYACIWDTDTCNQLQRLDHDKDGRGVIALGFSGNINAADEAGQGGDILITVTSDNAHTIHVWRWMNSRDKFCKAVYIPGWFYGPSKKLDDLKAANMFFKKPTPDEVGRAEVEMEVEKGSHPLIREVQDPTKMLKADAAEGFWTEHKRMTPDGTMQLLALLPGFQGTPPMVYGVAWNPFRPQHGGAGSEFLSYGVKHLKTWIMGDEGTWVQTNASFGVENVQNVLSAIYVPALHAMAAPGDSCILAGFARGEIGLFVPPYPTRAGSTYSLTRLFQAHAPGPCMTLTDGSMQYGGVRVIVLRADYRTILTGGADGHVVMWDLKSPEGFKPDGTPRKGVVVSCRATPNEAFGPNRCACHAAVTACCALHCPASGGQCDGYKMLC